MAASSRPSPVGSFEDSIGRPTRVGAKVVFNRSGRIEPGEIVRIVKHERTDRFTPESMLYRITIRRPSGGTSLVRNADGIYRI